MALRRSRCATGGATAAGVREAIPWERAAGIEPEGQKRVCAVRSLATKSPAGACARSPRVVCGTGFAGCFPRSARGGSDKSPFGSVAAEEFRAQRGVWRSPPLFGPGRHSRGRGLGRAGRGKEVAHGFNDFVKAATFRHRSPVPQATVLQVQGYHPRPACLSGTADWLDRRRACSHSDPVPSGRPCSW